MSSVIVIGIICGVIGLITGSLLAFMIPFGAYLLLYALKEQKGL